MSEGKKEGREKNSVEMVTKQDFWIIALLVTQSMSLVAPLETGVYVCTFLLLLLLLYLFEKVYFIKKKGIVFAFEDEQ